VCREGGIQSVLAAIADLLGALGVETSTQNSTLTLPGSAPGGALTVNLGSDNTGVATAPPTATFQPFTISAKVRATGVAPGSVSIQRQFSDACRSHRQRNRKLIPGPAGLPADKGGRRTK